MLVITINQYKPGLDIFNCSWKQIYILEDIMQIEDNQWINPKRPLLPPFTGRVMKDISIQ